MMNFTGAEHVLNWEIWYTSLLTLHVFAGITALLTFWIPLAVVKGSKLHIGSGIIFLVSIAIVVACGSIMAVMLMYDPIHPPQDRATTIFFLYICLFTASAAWHGIRVFQIGQHPSPPRIMAEKIQAILVGIVGAFVSFAGYAVGSLLLVIFPLIGIGLAIGQFNYWNNWPPASSKLVLREHSRAMITCVISTITAFCVIAVPRMTGWPGDSFLLWFGPTLVFLPIILYWRYRLR